MIEYVDQNPYTFKVANIALHEAGREKIAAAEKELGGLMALRETLAGAQPLKGAMVMGASEVSARMAVVIETLVALGAKVRWCSVDRERTENEVAAALARGEVGVYAWKGESWAEYWWCMGKAMSFGEKKGPSLVVDGSGRVEMLMRKGLEFAQNTQLFLGKYSDEAEDYFELVEHLRTVRGTTDWVKMKDELKGSVWGSELEIINGLMALWNNK